MCLPVGPAESTASRSAVGCWCTRLGGDVLPVIQACSDPTHETWDNARTLSGSPLRSGLISGESEAAARRQQFPIAFWQ